MNAALAAFMSRGLLRPRQPNSAFLAMQGAGGESQKGSHA